jgi:hypothetical protein
MKGMSDRRSVIVVIMAVILKDSRSLWVTYKFWRYRQQGHAKNYGKLLWFPTVRGVCPGI